MRSRRGPVWQAEHMTFDVQIEVRLRAGISDPQGATIERALPALGFDGVSGVGVGKSLRMRLDATDEAAALSQAEEMCARFLTNPVIEDSFISVTPAS